MIRNKKQMFIVVGVFALVMLLGTISYAFFNYTRTGAINNLGTGRIAFSSNQSNTLNITNVFPMTSSEAANANLDAVTIAITGDTTYIDGEEYLISLVDVDNTVNDKSIPINFIATYEATSGNTIGTSSNDYWNARENKDASIYTLNTTGKVIEGKQVLVGYIDNGATGINGTLTIKAYIDADRIALSDTYDGTESDNMGTTTEWVDERVVFTTSEWNSLSSTPISFKIRAESNEGIWVKEPGKIESCPGCKFMYLKNTPIYTTWNTHNETPTVLTSGLYDNYEELIEVTNKNYFLGVKLNNNNEVTNSYVCGVKNNEPFCVEGTLYQGPETATTYVANKTLLQKANVYNNTCIEYLDVNTGKGYDYTECGPWDNSSSLSAYANSSGYVRAGLGSNGFCLAHRDGYLECSEPKQIESCPGCKFMFRLIDLSDYSTRLWTTWNMGGWDDTNQVEVAETPTVLTSGLYDNYEELIATTNKNYFLGVKLNNNNEVTNAYACGVKDNVPFCIEGKLDSGLGGTEAATTYAINQSLLQGANLYNNTCTEYLDANTGNGFDYIECGPWDNSGSLSAFASSYGDVDAGVGNYGHCFVSNDGHFGCLESDSGGPGPDEPAPGGGGAG